MLPYWQRRRRKSLMKRDRPLVYRPVLLIIFFVMVSLSNHGCDAIPKRHFESSEKMWTDGDYKGALREYEKIIEDYPKSTVERCAHGAGDVPKFQRVKSREPALNSFQTLV